MIADFNNPTKTPEFISKQFAIVLEQNTVSRFPIVHLLNKDDILNERMLIIYQTNDKEDAYDYYVKVCNSLN